MLSDKLQEPIDTEKLRLAQADPAFQKSIAEYIVDPIKDIPLTEEERVKLDIPMYSLSEVFPDFLKIFKPIKTLLQEININSVCGTVEQQHENYKFDFAPLNLSNPDVAGIVAQLEAGTFDSQQNPIIVHAIPFGDKFEGFVATGAHIVAAFKQMDRDKIWARVTFYKETKKRRD